MKKLFYQKKIRYYEYSSIEKCEKHIKKMSKRGWKAIIQKIDNDGRIWYCFLNGYDRYTAELYKETNYK